MSGELLRDPQEITIRDGSGKDRVFILSKIPAWDGLEIIERLPSTFLTEVMPKLGDRAVINELKSLILKYVFIDLNGKKQSLCTQALIDNHCGDGECLFKLLKAEVTYNNSFFRNGTLSDFLNEAFQMALARISEILGQSSEQLSPMTKPPSTNSGQSTP